MTAQDDMFHRIDLPNTAARSIRGILVDHDEELFEALQRHLDGPDWAKPFAISVGLKITKLHTKQKVEMKIGWANKFSADAVPVEIGAETQPDMVDDAKAAKEIAEAILDPRKIADGATVEVTIDAEGAAKLRAAAEKMSADHPWPVDDNGRQESCQYRCDADCPAETTDYDDCPGVQTCRKVAGLPVFTDAGDPSCGTLDTPDCPISKTDDRDHKCQGSFRCPHSTPVEPEQAVDNHSPGQDATDDA